MALYIKRETPEYTLAIWRTDESLEQLYALLPNADELKAESAGMKSPHRLLEWFSVRALLRCITGSDIPIHYQPSGKPYIDGGYISISHTKGYVAIIISSTHQVAIDIEQYSERVRKVAKRFMHESESATNTYGYLLLWSAKESIYKLIGDAVVDFRESIRIEPFEVMPFGDTLRAEAKIKETLWKRLLVSYTLEQDFVLTWTVS
jgi:phosphopantetheinyl transferase